MSTATDLPGFEVPLHRSLTEPILLGGAPRTVAIANGTLAAAVGLGLQLWIPGVVLWIVGHSLAVWGARVDPQLVRMQEEIAKLREQTERSEAARRDVEQRAQRESARRGLADALSAKGITGARQRAVIADLESRGAFKIEEDGSPSLTVERVRVKGARATEMAHRNLSEAVEDWVQTDDAKEFLPAVVNAAGKPSAARMPAGQAKTFDLTTEEGAAAAALALLGGD